METHGKNGKSTTSSAADSANYPDPHHSHVNEQAELGHQDIAHLAYTLWEKRGCPSGSAGQDWSEAEQILHASQVGQSAIRHVESQGGSVQA
jgi:hypothetical protein